MNTTTKAHRLTAGERLDFVTLTYSAELRLLQMQARSFARFMPEDLVGKIWIVVNESQPAASVEAINRTVLPLYGHLAGRVVILCGTDLVGDYVFTHKGWYSQQVLKLEVSRKIEAKAYIVLDSKNHFVRPASRSRFVGPSGLLKQRSLNMLPVYWKRPLYWLLGKNTHLPRRYKGAFEYFDLSPVSHAGEVVPTTTPFPLYRDLTVRLLDYVEQREQVCFATWFERYFEATEFYLSQAYPVFLGLGFDDIYEKSGRTGVILFPQDVAQGKTAERKIQSLESQEVMVFGVHRQALPLIREQTKKQLEKIWVDRGLLMHNESIDYFITGDCPTEIEQSHDSR